MWHTIFDHNDVTLCGEEQQVIESSHTTRIQPLQSLALNTMCRWSLQSDANETLQFTLDYNTDDMLVYVESVSDGVATAVPLE